MVRIAGISHADEENVHMLNPLFSIPFSRFNHTGNGIDGFLQPGEHFIFYTMTADEPTFFFYYFLKNTAVSSLFLST